MNEESRTARQAFGPKEAREILLEGVATNHVAGNADTAALRSSCGAAGRSVTRSQPTQTGCGLGGTATDKLGLRPSLNNHQKVERMARNPSSPMPVSPHLA